MMLVLVAGLIGLYLFYDLYWKRRPYPPGPTPVPIAGTILPVIRHEPGYKAFEIWKQRYGPVYTHWLGPYPTVVIADYTIIKDTIIKDGDKYADRFTTSLSDLFRGGSYGVIETNGALWKEMRRFSLHTLRDFGMGKSLMESKILCEVSALIDRLSKNGVVPSMQWEFDLAVGSIINNILFGYRFDEEREEEFRRLKAVLNRHFKTITSFSAALAFTQPWTRVLPPVRRTMDELLANRDALFSFFGAQAEAVRRKMTFDSDDSDNLVECFLKEQRKREHEPDFGDYSVLQLHNLLLDLWIAGMETTSNTLTWGIAFILNHPEVQRRIHAELEREIRSGRQITMQDKPALNYLNATINEIQRLANLLPVNLFRRTTEDVTINGHNVPKGTAVIPQISCVLFDEEIFPEPQAFKPERFLNDDGSLRKVEELVPFSVGKRQCPGEGLARMELFLFLSNLFQQLKVSADETPSLRKVASFTVCPLPYGCRFVRKE